MNLPITDLIAIIIVIACHPKVVTFSKCRKLFLELLSVFMSKIVMVKCLKVGIVSFSFR